MGTILSVEEKQLLEKRYEDLEFVEGIEEELKCGRCQRLTIRHYFSQCGHVFCDNCRQLLTDSPCKCPRCHAPIHSLAKQKAEFEQRIYAVKVFCPNKKYGCPVATTLLLLPEHLRQCKDMQKASLLAELSFDEGIKSMLNKFEEMSKQMNNVVNKVNQLEQKVSQLDNIEMSLENVKQQTELTKTNKQAMDKLVGQMEIKNEVENLRNKVEGQEQRLSVTNQTILNTSLELRVNEEQTKKQVESLKGTIEPLNEKMRKLEQEMGQTKQLNFSIDKLKVQMEQNFKLQMKKWNKYEESPIDGDDDILYNFFYCNKYEPTVLKSVVYRWMLKDILQLTQKKTFEYESEAFPLPGYPFVAKAKLTLKQDDYVYFAMCFKNSSGHKLQTNDVIPRLTCVLKDVKNKQEMKHQIRTYTYLFNSPMQYDIYYHNCKLTRKSWLTVSNYNADDSVEILFLVEPSSVAFRLMSTDGSVVQRISNYRHRLQLAREQHYECHSSPYFSTKRHGYQVVVWFWINGFGDFQGKGLTAEISFLCGEYDTQLAKSFKHTTTVTLMNQMDLSSHLIQSAVEDISVKRSYFVNMATHEEIEDGGYLLNDSLIYQINIQPI